jgi:hypothetical protein
MKEPLPLDPELKCIDGAQELYDWFGYWPDFHDAEILSLHLNRSGSSPLAIHTWVLTGEIDERNFYVRTKHVTVEFSLSGISDLNLNGFSIQNVIGDLYIEKASGGFRLTLGPCYGLAGTIVAEKISIRLNPGQATDRNR